MHTTAKKNKEIISLCISIVIVILEVIGAMMSTWVVPLKQFMYYTQNSNYLLLIATLIWIVCILRYLRDGVRIPRWVYLLKYMATSMVSLTFLVAFFVLGIMCGDVVGMMLINMYIYFHTLCPLLAVVDFLFFERGQEWKKIHVVMAMVPTLVYGVIAILMNLLRIWNGPYPFLLVYENPVWLSCLSAVAIPGLALIVALLLRAGNSAFTREYTY